MPSPSTGASAAIEQLRTLALVGPSAAGKTSLAEALLHRAGVIGAPGTLERGSTVSDFDPLERRMQHSLNAAVLHLDQDVYKRQAERKPVTAVNPKTVVERDGRKLVFRITGDGVEVIPVTVGRTLGDALEITGSALKPADRLVLGPGDKLVGGAKVSVAGK